MWKLHEPQAHPNSLTSGGQKSRLRVPEKLRASLALLPGWESHDIHAELELAILKKIPVRHANAGMIIQKRRAFQLKTGHPLADDRLI
jgi:hypothetical protein